MLRCYHLIVTGTLGYFTEHLSAKTAKNKPCLGGYITGAN